METTHIEFVSPAVDEFFFEEVYEKGQYGLMYVSPTALYNEYFAGRSEFTNCHRSVVEECIKEFQVWYHTDDNDDA